MQTSVLQDPQTESFRSSDDQVTALTQRIAELEAERAEMDHWIRTAANVCDQAAHGNLEARLLNINIEGPLGRMAHSINGMLDYTDAFVREARASLEAAAQGRFFRRVLLQGMAGTFKQASQIINKSTTYMRAKSEAIAKAEAQRLEIADEFEATVKSISDAIAAMACDIRDVSGRLST
ncbi:MAG: hypothetical protein KDA92_20020, partial [Planctomycetales bacterium]|nr:hypothetical protein [Planctomycetales bacterium]